MLSMPAPAASSLPPSLAGLSLNSDAPPPLPMNGALDCATLERRSLLASQPSRPPAAPAAPPMPMPAGGLPPGLAPPPGLGLGRAAPAAVDPLRALLGGATGGSGDLPGMSLPGGQPPARDLPGMPLPPGTQPPAHRLPGMPNLEAAPTVVGRSLPPAQQEERGQGAAAPPPMAPAEPTPAAAAAAGGPTPVSEGTLQKVVHEARLAQAEWQRLQSLPPSEARHAKERDELPLEHAPPCTHYTHPCLA